MQNSSFEAGVWHKTYTGVEYDNIFVPEQWVAWWKENSTYGRIEMQVIKAEVPFLDPPRVHEGAKALKFFTMWRLHQAGVFQTVATMPGTTYRVRFFAHAWSSQNDDPYTSEGAPGAFFALEGTPGLTDDQRNFTFCAGVDTSGAANPFADTVRWGQGAHIYNTYAEVPALEFTAIGTSVTVFLRSSVLWPFKHCDAYMDAVVFEVAETPSPCPPGPREQFHRTYNVIPADATEERAVEIFREGWRRSKESAGGSYDDAGKWGGIEHATARLYDIPAEQRQAFLDFYNGPDGFYPGTEVLFAGDSPEPLRFDCPTTHDPPVVVTQPFVPGQHLAIDLRSSWALWGDEAVAAFPGTVINDPTVYDATFGYQVLTRITSGENTVEVRYAHLVAVPYVRRGDTVVRKQKLGRIDNTGASSGDHLHYSIKLNGVYVDPELLTDLPGTPDESPRPDGTNLHITLHFTPTGGDYLDVQNFMQTICPAVVKVCTAGGGGPQLELLRQWSPNTLRVYRIVDNDLNRFDPSQAAPFVARNLADLQPFGIDDFSRAPIYIESINEAYECGATANNAATMAFDLAFIDAVNNAYSNGANVKAVVFTAPVGNPHVSQEDLGPLLPLVDAAIAGGHLLGPHGYYPSVPGDPLFYQTVSEWYQERFEQFDAYFASQGREPFWYIGEGGACQATVGSDGYISLNPGCGWKGCGSILRYADELAWLEGRYAAWNAAHGGRLLGCSLFTTYGWGWDLFNLINGDLDVVTARLSTLL